MLGGFVSFPPVVPAHSSQHGLPLDQQIAAGRDVAVSYTHLDVYKRQLKARVLVKKAEQVAGGFGEPFDVIFIDPPYALSLIHI